MKRLLITMALICAGTALFAQIAGFPEHQFAAGNWRWVGTRAYQYDASSGLAKANVRIAQSGPMIYDFNVRYESGLLEDKAGAWHGGFGIHLFGDSAYNGPSWGAGKSILLWLNYDEKPLDSKIPAGLSAQVYRSISNSQMELIDSVDFNDFVSAINSYDVLSAVLSQPIPFKIWADGNTGEIRVYDPTDPQGVRYFYYFLDQKDVPLRGNWISVRTNGISLSFGSDQF